MKKMIKCILFLSLALGITFVPQIQDQNGSGMSTIQAVKDPGGGGMG